MCYTCGCNQPHNNHGNPKNITEEQIKESASASGVDVNKAKQNMETLIDKEEDLDQVAKPSKNY